MTTISIDGLTEDEFRRSIERKLRHGKAAEAVEALRRLLAPYAGDGRVLPERFLTVGPDELSFKRWERLAEAIARHDSPGKPITALSIAFGWPGEFVPEPDAQGCLKPHIETAYYTDDAFPFSKSGREDLLEGYSYYGCTWTDDCQASDSALMVEGIDDLHGALALLEARLLASAMPEDEEIRAGSLGACLLSVLLFQAVGDKIGTAGLPRPLCVMSGSNGVYPYFDAPVAGFPLEVRQAAEAAEEESVEGATGVPGPRYSSLLMTGIPRARKRAVLVLEESKEDEANRIAKLRGLGTAPVQPDAEPENPEPREAGEEILESAASPLMTKNPGGHQAWDFREMLTPRKPGADGDEDNDTPPVAAPIDFGLHAPAPETGESVSFEADAEPIDPEPGESEPVPSEPAAVEPDPDADWGDVPPFEPAEEAAVATPEARSQVIDSPGFTVFELDPQIHPQPYYPRPLVQQGEIALPRLALSEPKPAVLAQDCPEPLSFEGAAESEASAETGRPPAPEVLGPAWPLGIGWLEEIEARLLTTVPRAEPEVSPPAAPSLLARISNWWQGRR